MEPSVAMPASGHTVATEAVVVVFLLVCLQIVEGNIQASGRIDAQLKVKVISACMNELTRFPRR